MVMNKLTADDLQLIGGVVRGIVEPRFDALDRDIEAMAQDTAAGFAEVHARIDTVHSKAKE
jgi:hypothetical protein